MNTLEKADKFHHTSLEPKPPKPHKKGEPYNVDYNTMVHYMDNPKIYGQI